MVRHLFNYLRSVPPPPLNSSRRRNNSGKRAPASRSSNGRFHSRNGCTANRTLGRNCDNGACVRTTWNVYYSWRKSRRLRLLANGRLRDLVLRTRSMKIRDLWRRPRIRFDDPYKFYNIVKFLFTIYIYLFLTYFETAKAVTDAGSALSLRSYAVCIVSLLRNTNWRCHLKPINLIRNINNNKFYMMITSTNTNNKQYIIFFLLGTNKCTCLLYRSF